MTYTLMHQRLPVLDVELDDIQSAVIAVGAVHNLKHLPVGISTDNDKADSSQLAAWWSRRAIPASRSGLRAALEKLNVSVPQELVSKCFGLSLSDQYWICPVEQAIEWKSINFFDNAFSEDVGNILLGGQPQNNQLNVISPDSTSDGWLKKRWKIIEGKRCLLKGGSAPFYQEPLNEVLASAVMRRLGIPHVPYTLIWDGQTPYSVCEDFIDSRTDLVSAHQIMRTKPFTKTDDLYAHFLNCAQALGIPGVQDSLNRMLMLDYLIANSDRHYGNFGAVRDAETLEWRGMAPIFDNGTSLWCETINSFINPEANVESATFRKTHREQIRLVTSLDWLESAKLKDIPEEFAEILRESPFIEDERRRFLCSALKRRMAMLEELVMTQTQTVRLELR